MAHKKKHVAPVPPGNQSNVGIPGRPGQSRKEKRLEKGGEGAFHEQDPKRPLGDFTGTGEHSIQQPGGQNDANH